MRTKYFDLTEEIPGYPLETVMVEGKRYYVTPEGHKYPSVTTVLSTMSKDAILQWRARVGEEQAQKISTQASRRGTAVHLLAERYLMNEEDWDRDAMPSNLHTFKCIQEYLDKWCDNVYANEIALYSHDLQTAGRVDMIGRIHGIRTIGDFKTAKKAKKEEWIKNYFYQCTVYALMLHELTGIWCPQICVMIATDDDGLQVFLKRTADYVPEVREFFDTFHAKNSLLTEVQK